MNSLRWNPLLAFLWLLLWGTTATAVPLQVVTTILPQKQFVERIGGAQVQVSVLVGPGQSPETFEPTPRQMTALAEAALFYRIGMPFEELWFDRIVGMNRGISILDARDGIELREMEPAGGHHHDYDPHLHGEGAPDPHFWLSPLAAKEMAWRLRDRLIELRPEAKEEFTANHARFAAELDRLDAEIRSLLKDIPNRRFMIFHPALGYFADTYGLQQIPIEGEGKEAGAKTLARLIDQAREERVKTIFVQAQFSQTQARTIAKTLGAKVETLDPLAEEYIENLRRVAHALAGALEGPPP